MCDGKKWTLTPEISTHSRAKAAGCAYVLGYGEPHRRNFNSQPREGGWNGRTKDGKSYLISTHSRAKAAGPKLHKQKKPKPFQLTAARRRLDANDDGACYPSQFQLTAARRRLGRGLWRLTGAMHFNSQPREGGWAGIAGKWDRHRHFNSQPREGGWLFMQSSYIFT